MSNKNNHIECRKMGTREVINYVALNSNVNDASVEEGGIVIYDINSAPENISIDDLVRIKDATNIVLYDSSYCNNKPDVFKGSKLKLIDISNKNILRELEEYKNANKILKELISKYRNQLYNKHFYKKYKKFFFYFWIKNKIKNSILFKSKEERAILKEVNKIKDIVV